jgi:hypothetical protein
MTWARHLFNFYLTLEPPSILPDGVEWLYPQKRPEVQTVLKQFLNKYYNDSKPRNLLLGINPGRYGAGVTGVNFTAPKQLTEDLSISHSFKMQSELSAEFIYRMIDAYGGPEAFYSHHFISSVCPFGLVKDGRNINYYDDGKLMQALEPFIISSTHLLLEGNFPRNECVLIGGEKNYKFFARLNAQHQWFKNITPLPHPRFIMQYKRKKVEEYVDLYLEKLKN